MRKRIFGRRLKRDTNERKALFSSLIHGLILHGKISTTEAKAKAIRGDVDKLITIAKTRGDDARRQLMKKLVNERATDKILAEIAPKFADRAGGYTRILRKGSRIKDGASMVYMSWTETVVATDLKTPKRNVDKKTAKTPKVKVKKETRTTKKSSKK